MKNLFTLLVLFLSFVSISQEEVDYMTVPSNEINFEHGYLNRGLMGISYGRNFAKKEMTYFSVAGSAGLGVQLVDEGFLFETYPIVFFGISPSFQYGVRHSFLSLGLEVKNISSNDAYNGFGIGAYAGFSYNGPRGFLFKLRLGATNWSDGSTGIPYYEFADQRLVIPMLGSSIGFSFGNRL